MYAGFRRSTDTSSVTVNFECVRLTVLVEVQVWGDIRDLEDPTKGTLPSEDVRDGSQVPEDEG